MIPEKIYVILEIPEFKGMNVADKFKKIKITGLETEKPIVRIDNFVFQGKWYFNNNSIFFSFSKNVEKINEDRKKFFSLFRLKRKNKNKSSFVSKLGFSNQLGFFLKKRLRLYRLSLGLLKN
ncbi:hypothetical protein HAN_1g55 (nucleomorph) [Hemiselmis andersenii]|uniref:Transcription factor TFIIIC triple barrel domain-containing protein n=1 Tax=Hemiselmis andersenii TaxID=464988 RepID=A9BK67_HEMAN|nr:hypothetical protein HAN_1g55 [Hemiselmis andersenii]ABW97900.1 hypothetical protein HAN_1g55 [Hemiselmis andersenii]|mmetsp:Transcript_42126/g.98149  ORF Transcript_42126/g.98149 Transcript_42126/m.98149 type:complete len:122 (+) Transcript_42126:1784-2149(+)